VTDTSAVPSPLTALRRVPWMRVWLAAQWLYRQGRRRLEENLSERERRELLELMRKSKGRQSNLSSREQDRLRRLVRKALTGRDPR
jgi:hypothetical protein